jgi:hypothetical protein
MLWQHASLKHQESLGFPTRIEITSHPVTSVNLGRGEPYTRRPFSSSRPSVGGMRLVPYRSTAGCAFINPKLPPAYWRVTELTPAVPSPG